MNGRTFQVARSERDSSGRTLIVNGELVQVEILRELGKRPLHLILRSNGRILHILLGEKDERGLFPITVNGRTLHAELELVEVAHAGRARVPVQEGPVVVRAPMAGRIVSLKTAVGKSVEEGEALVVLEAMKMENEVSSPKKGSLKEVYVETGALVKAGDKLVLIE